jgi:ketosteroid isomerase-like protein
VQSNAASKDVALAAFAAWNSGDLDRWLEMIHPNIVWISSGAFPGLRPSYSGHREIRDFWNDFQEPWERIEIEIARIFEVSGDSVLVTAYFHARGRYGVEVDREVANHLVIRDGKVWRQTAYPSWQAAFAKFGIEEGGTRESVR